MEQKRKIHEVFHSVTQTKTQLINEIRSNY